MAFAGLATSHPFTIARLATRFRDLELSVWDVGGSGAERFASEFGARRFDSLAGLLRTSPDVVVTSVRPRHAAETVRAVLDSGAPCYHSKVAAATPAQFADLDRAVSQQGHRYLGGSVLRFAPALSTRAADTVVTGVDVVVRHDIAIFLEGDRRWQDEPNEGGGTAISLGVHGWDIASAILGETLVPLGGETSNTCYPSKSEDTAALRAVSASGATVSVTIVGVSDHEEYSAVIHSADGPQTLVLGGGDEDVSLGYAGTVNAIFAMANGGLSPVSWEHSRNVIETSIVAAALARRSGLTP